MAIDGVKSVVDDVESGEKAFVSYEVQGAFAWIRLARPECGNAQNFRMLAQLDDCFRRAVDDEAVRVIIFGGEGKHFSAGHDLGTPDRDKHLERPRAGLWPNHLEKSGAEAQYVLEQDAYLGLCRRWHDIPKPTVAIVQGACIAGGLMLAMMCDLIIATDDAFFQDPVVKMGIPGVEYPAHMLELPTRIAREFLFLGLRLSAQRAYELGMINRVVPREMLEKEALAVAGRIAEMPAFGLTLTKQAMNLIEDMRGNRAAMDAIFHIHHLAHTHNQLLSGSVVASADPKTFVQANKDARA